MAERAFVDTPESDAVEADSPSDQQLIAAINNGDPHAFETLYRRYRNWVVQLASRITGDDHAALDVLQETFLYVLRKFPGFRLTANFKTFLYPAVRNLSITARRKSARYVTNDFVPADELVAKETPSTQVAELKLALAALPEDHREALLLRFVDGLSLVEIAQATDAPLGTVKSRLHYALEKLRQDPRTKEFFQE